MREADRDRGQGDQETRERNQEELPVGAVDLEQDDPEERDPHEQRGDHDGVHGPSALLRPVDVVEMQPQRELVERQAGADAERERRQLPPWRRIADREGDRRRDQHQRDPEHQVVDMEAAGRDAARPPRHLGTAHQARARADERERAEEADEDEEHSFPALVEDLLSPQLADDRLGHWLSDYRLRFTHGKRERRGPGEAGGGRGRETIDAATQRADEMVARAEQEAERIRARAETDARSGSSAPQEAVDRLRARRTSSGPR